MKVDLERAKKMLGILGFANVEKMDPKRAQSKLNRLNVSFGESDIEECDNDIYKNLFFKILEANKVGEEVEVTVKEKVESEEGPSQESVDKVWEENSDSNEVKEETGDMPDDDFFTKDDDDDEDDSDLEDDEDSEEAAEKAAKKYAKKEKAGKNGEVKERKPRGVRKKLAPGEVSPKERVYQFWIASAKKATAEECHSHIGGEGSLSSIRGYLWNWGRGTALPRSKKEPKKEKKSKKEKVTVSEDTE